MKTLRTLILLLSLAAGIAGACAATVTPSKHFVTRKVTSGAFDAVRTDTSIDIIYTTGPRSIEICAPDNLINYIKITLRGSEIIVGYKENMKILSSHKSYVKISAPDVCSFTTASSGDIKIKSNLKGHSIKMSVLSAGDIEAMDIEAYEVSLTTNSAGDIDVGNIRADFVNLRVSSAGDIETGDIIARKDAKIAVNSAGDISVDELVVGELATITTNSAGSIDIREVSVTTVKLNANSSGDLEIDCVKATNVIASATSTGDIELAGITDKATLSSSSTGSIMARKLRATDVTATTRNVGSVECYAIRSLDASRLGSGVIKYAGKPASITINDSRKGGVKPL